MMIRLTNMDCFRFMEVYLLCIMLGAIPAGELPRYSSFTTVILDVAPAARRPISGLQKRFPYADKRLLPLTLLSFQQKQILAGEPPALHRFIISSNEIVALEKQRS